MSPGSPVAGSFRDPAGFVFRRDGRLLRQVNRSCAADYDHLMASGLYAALAGGDQLIPHEEVAEAPHTPGPAYKVLRPAPVPFVSYPYEWCFGQLRAAALLTLAAHRRALDFGMALKDASAFNVQFLGSRPLLIDTLSFERYAAGEPWVAYRQFCQHFLAPLALMSLRDVRLGSLLRANLDGVPLDLAATLLPIRSRLRPSLLLHLHLHARWQRTYAGRAEEWAGRPARQRSFGRTAMLGLIDSLESAVRGLRWQPRGTGWVGYYEDNTYTAEALAEKRRVVADWLGRADPRTVWDLGANTGLFSRLASDHGISTVAVDGDPACVEKMYSEAAERGDTHLLPLLVDLANPSPALGWGNRERMTLAERGPADAVLALGLVHHLAIAGNVPLGLIARFLASLGAWLVIEFIPREDPQVGRLLAGRKDVFADYGRESFECDFAGPFTTLDCRPLPAGGRALYLMRRRGA
jgi:ribosomal protein L11 methylase PrmA